MTVKFKGPGITRHGRLMIAPAVATSFEDPNAEEYFVAMGWAEETNEAPVVEYPEGSVEVDPETVFADGPKKGQKVLPELSNASKETVTEEAE